MAGFNDYATAIQMRDAIREIVATEVAKYGLDQRYAVVTSVDPTSGTASVQFPEETDPLPITIGPIPPYVGQRVRVEGNPGDRYTNDYDFSRYRQPYVGPTQPDHPQPGDIWINTTFGRLDEFIYNGSFWVPRGVALRLARDTDQAVLNATGTSVTWPTDEYDPLNMHAPGAAGIVVPTGMSGLWHMEFHARVSAGAYVIWINTPDGRFPAQESQGTQQVSIAVEYYVGEGQTVSCSIWNASTGGTTQVQGKFVMHYVDSPPIP